MNHFPDCEILMMPQRSDEWFAARKGILTASSFGAWLLKDSDQKSKDARENAICRLIAERANCWEPPSYDDAATKWGSELEPDAIDAFMIATGKNVEQVGFCRSIYGAFGCSPDGLLVDESTGLEGKVPLGRTQVRRRRAGVLPDEYYHQIHGSMAVTGATAWWFQSWYPGLTPFRIKVERDAFTEKLKAALILFSMQFEEAWIQERAAVAAMRKGAR